VSNTLTAIDENSGTASHIKVADIAVTDDALGSNTLGLSGADAANFEIVGGALFLRAGVTLDYEAKASYAVNVNVNDASVGGNPDATQSFVLNVNNLAEGVAATDLRLVVDSVPNGNGLATGDFAHFAFTDPDGGGAHSFSMTASSNNAASAGTVLSLSGAGILSTTGLAANTVYTLDVQTTQAGASAYGETFHITTGTNAVDTLGGSGDDIIYAQQGNDVVLAGSGDDTVFGQADADTLNGGDGNDVLYGNAGNDTLKGTPATTPSTAAPATTSSREEQGPIPSSSKTATPGTTRWTSTPRRRPRKST
jgi:Ca2+-binding RTX toxin-like protein